MKTEPGGDTHTQKSYFKVVKKGGVTYRTSPDMTQLHPGGRGPSEGDTIVAGPKSNADWVCVFPWNYWLPRRIKGVAVLESAVSESAVSESKPVKTEADGAMSLLSTAEGLLRAFQSRMQASAPAVRRGQRPPGPASPAVTRARRACTTTATTTTVREKQPKTAYNFFQLEVREQISKELRASMRVAPNQQVMKEIGRQWRALSSSERERYQEMASSARAAPTKRSEPQPDPRRSLRTRRRTAEAASSETPPAVAAPSTRRRPTRRAAAVAAEVISDSGAGSGSSGDKPTGVGSDVSISSTGTLPKRSSSRRGKVLADPLLPCPKCNNNDRAIRNGWSRMQAGRPRSRSSGQGRVQRFRCRRCNLDYRSVAPLGAPPPPKGSPQTFSISLSQGGGSTTTTLEPRSRSRSRSRSRAVSPSGDEQNSRGSRSSAAPIKTAPIKVSLSPPRSPASSRSAAPLTPGGTPAGPWSCPKCTLLNPEGRMACSVCGQKKPRRSRTAVEAPGRKRAPASRADGADNGVDNGVDNAANGGGTAAKRRRTTGAGENEDSKSSRGGRSVRSVRSRGVDPGYQEGDAVEAKWCTTWYNVRVSGPVEGRKGYYSAVLQNSRMEFHFSKLRPPQRNRAFVDGSVAEREASPEEIFKDPISVRKRRGEPEQGPAIARGTNRGDAAEAKR